MGAYARIALRYGAGAILGMEAGEILAGDPDMVLAVGAAMAVSAEWAYLVAKSRGWAT